MMTSVTVYIFNLCNTVNERGSSSLLKWSEFETPFKLSSMRPSIKANLKFLWDNFEQGVGRTKLFRMKGPGVSNTALLSISRPVCYSWLQFPYLSQKLPSAARWFTSARYVHPFCFLTMAVKSLLILAKCHSVSVWEMLSTKNLLYLCLILSDSIYFPCKQIIIYATSQADICIQFMSNHFHSPG